MNYFKSSGGTKRQLRKLSNLLVVMQVFALQIFALLTSHVQAVTYPSCPLLADDYTALRDYYQSGSDYPQIVGSDEYPSASNDPQSIF